MCILPEQTAVPTRPDLVELGAISQCFLQPEMNIKLAVQYFEQNENEALAVVDDEKDHHVVGLLTEAHVLRRYTDELDKAHRELSGESWVGN